VGGAPCREDKERRHPFLDDEAMVLGARAGTRARRMKGPWMVSVLFVDDNIMGLRALRETFSSCNEGWETAFAPGAEVALHIMAERPVDAVVASTRLSGVSAANFLRMAKVQFPKTARIALSNPGDRGAMLSALPVANQCLSKACGPIVLASAVEHTTKLQRRLFSEETQRMVAEVGSLPSLPATLTAVDNALSDEDCSLGQIADIMSGDVSMVAKVLQLVNSSFFGLRAEIHDLRHALAYLGIETLRDFAMAGAAVRVFRPSEILTDGWLATFNAHAVAVADVASQLVRTSVAQCEASVAGTLHDVGELVVAERVPAKLLAIADDVAAGSSPDDAEIRHLGTTYPVIGGYLLSQWGIGYNVVEAITCQREAWAGPARGPALGDVIRLADYLVANRLTAAERDPSLLSEPAMVNQSRANDSAPAPVCQASRLIEADEDYQERVGLLGAVRLYDQGFLRL